MFPKLLDHPTWWLYHRAAQELLPFVATNFLSYFFCACLTYRSTRMYIYFRYGLSTVCEWVCLLLASPHSFKGCQVGQAETEKEKMKIKRNRKRNRDALADGIGVGSRELGVGDLEFWAQDGVLDQFERNINQNRKPKTFARRLPWMVRRRLWRMRSVFSFILLACLFGSKPKNKTKNKKPPNRICSVRIFSIFWAPIKVLIALATSKSKWYYN